MKILILLLFIVISLFFSESALAQIGITRQPDSNRGSKVTGNPVNDLGTLVNNLLTLFFTVGGIAFVIMILWGAVDWILSGGDKEKLAGARKRITTAIIGLVLLSLTFVILVVLGQILGLKALYSGQFEIKGLLE